MQLCCKFYSIMPAPPSEILAIWVAQAARARVPADLLRYRLPPAPGEILFMGRHLHPSLPHHIKVDLVHRRSERRQTHNSTMMKPARATVLASHVTLAQPGANVI